MNGENRVKCGKCGTESDLNKNDGCPLCGFGRGSGFSRPDTTSERIKSGGGFLMVPKDIKTIPGKLLVSSQTKTVGGWGMFNSFFPGKAMLRIASNIIGESGEGRIRLDQLVSTAAEVFRSRALTSFRGFPKDPSSESSLGRLVYHFVRTFSEMGLAVIQKADGSVDEVWDEPWSDLYFCPSKAGLEFAQLPNRVFDANEQAQVLSPEEKEWLVGYLQSIDKEEYREFSMLESIFKFIEAGHNGKDELWNWLSQNQAFRAYVKSWSRKTSDKVALDKQISSLAQTFSAGKLALLRELGVVKNKRNDYSIVGDLG